MKRIHNFGAGPAKIPDEVVEEIRDTFPSYQGRGFSICEVGHRSALFEDILNTAIQNFRSVMEIPENYHVVFVSAGASIHYAMVPLNFSRQKKVAFINTGIWSKKAIAEAQKNQIEVKIAASSEDTGFDRIPNFDHLNPDNSVDYLHVTSNNTIYGSQYHRFPQWDNIPLIVDMTSDIASRKIDISRFAMLYAGMQKNLGISGLSIAVIRKDLTERIPQNMATLLNYNTYIETNSMFNTPNTFGIYVAGLILKWMIKKGGLKALEAVNRRKAEKLYQIIDKSQLYQSRVQKSSRSLMNITFYLDTPESEKRFLSEAEKRDLYFLKGHRLNGGIRASIYNATEMNSVDALAEFLTDFEKR